MIFKKKHEESQREGREDQREGEGSCVYVVAVMKYIRIANGP